MPTARTSGSSWPPSRVGPCAGAAFAATCATALPAAPSSMRSPSARNETPLPPRQWPRAEACSPSARRALLTGAWPSPTVLGVDVLRPRLDILAFTLALAVLAWLALGFVTDHNGGATIMSAMCLAGLVAGRIVGVPGRVLLPVAIGLAVVLWLIWIDSPVGAHKTSAFAHVVGGTLAGWGLVEALRRRIRDPLTVALVALTGVIALTLTWELGEYVGDRLLGTSPTERGRLPGGHPRRHGRRPGRDDACEHRCVVAP